MSDDEPRDPRVRNNEPRGSGVRDNEPRGPRLDPDAFRNPGSAFTRDPAPPDDSPSSDPPKKSHAESHGIAEDAGLSPDDAAAVERVTRALEAQQTFERGARSFQDIAMFSLINTALIHMHAGIVFIGALGITRLADGIARYLAPTWGAGVTIAAIAFDLMAAGLFVGLAMAAKQHKRWAFGVGALLYVLDTGICMWIGDYLEVAFHIFLLTSIFAGWRASRTLERLADETGQDAFERDPAEAPGPSPTEPL